jgi:RNA polymerase sigma factor (sigma-70 family)
MIEDAELLRRYATDRSEAAFAELVQRHLALVYSVARRQVEPDRHLAEDVAQKVFADLARKADSLSRHPVLTGWLYCSTRFTAIDLVRSERRRRTREQEAQAMQEIMNDSGGEPETEKLRPVLDQAMSELAERDRDAVMLRFFEARPFAEIAAKFRLTEDAARRRVERALEKLRLQLARRGITSTTAALATVLAGQAGVGTPSGLAATVTGGALVGAGATTAVATFFGAAKMQLALAGVALVAGGGGLAWQRQANDRWQREIAADQTAPQEVAALREENRRLAESAAEARNYQVDPQELARLRDRASALVERTRNIAQSESARQAANTASTGEAATAARTTQPQPLVQPKPVYPFDLRRAGVGGMVKVEMIIDQKGTVRSAFYVPSGSGDRKASAEFAKEAVTAVMKWKFSPATADGQPVATRITVPVVFRVVNEWF